MTEEQGNTARGTHIDEEPGMSLGEVVGVLLSHLKLLIVVPLVAGCLSLGVTYFIAPTFTASTTFMPPQQAQSGAASALASLGSLAGLAGNAAGIGSSGDRYVALMQSATVSERIVDNFNLMELYGVKFRIDARRALAKNVRFTLGKKDGLIVVEVDDGSPQRAADIANRYVDELRRLTGTLAVTEAQQRRAFFENQLAQSRDRLAQAQQALQSSGFNASALKVEPKAAAETYAKLKAEVTAAEVRLQVLRGSLAEGTPEVRLQQATLAALREQLTRVEQATGAGGGPDYVGKYREFKYQETLFELYARQFELARADESREGALIQVVDRATPPERKSKPKRATTAITITLITFLFFTAFLLMRHVMRRRASLQTI